MLRFQNCFQTQHPFIRFTNFMHSLIIHKTFLLRTLCCLVLILSCLSARILFAGQKDRLNDLNTAIKEDNNNNDLQKLKEIFKADGITVDLKRKRVEVKGVIIRDKLSPQYPIEYVVVSEGGNAYEAIILIKALPSHLNAALLSIGLTPGKTVSKRLLPNVSGSTLEGSSEKKFLQAF